MISSVKVKYAVNSSQLTELCTKQLMKVFEAHFLAFVLLLSFAMAVHLSLQTQCRQQFLSK